MAGVAVDDLPVYPALPLAFHDCLDPGADGRSPGPEHAARHEGVEVGEQGLGQAYRYLPHLHPKKYIIFEILSIDRYRSLVRELVTGCLFEVDWFPRFATGVAILEG